MGNDPAEDDRVDLNTASLERLMKLPGMTRVWAARIVKFRPYRRKDELVDRGVVTSEVYARIKDWVVAHRAKQ
jgi:DNA uptake protein ComE-like DNA-binding protein